MKAYFIILFFYFVGLGSNLSSLSPYLISNFGKDAEWVFVSIQIMVPAGTLFAGWISDKTKKIRIFLKYSILLTIPAQYLLFSFSENWLLTLFFGGTLRFLLSANYQWISIAALEKVGEHPFSKIRSAGTLGFLIIQFVLYILTLPQFLIFNSAESTGKFGSIFYLVSFFFLKFLPEYRKSNQEYRFRDALMLLKNRNLFLFFILSFFYYGAYQITDNYQGRYFELTFGLATVYLSWVFAVILEIPFLLLIPRIVHKYGYFILFYLSIISGSIRFLFLSYSVLGVPLYLLLLFQMPHAILFAGYYMGGIHFLRKAVPPHLYGSLYGLFSILSMSFGGMVGNIISSQLLHSGLGKYLINKSNFNSNYSPGIDFLPVFLQAGGIFILLLPFYFLLGKNHRFSPKT